MKDYIRRIKDHERHYEPVDEPEHPWIRVINVGEKIQVNVRMFQFLAPLVLISL